MERRRWLFTNECGHCLVAGDKPEYSAPFRNGWLTQIREDENAYGQTEANNYLSDNPSNARLLEEQVMNRNVIIGVVAVVIIIIAVILLIPGGDQQGETETTPPNPAPTTPAPSN